VKQPIGGNQFVPRETSPKAGDTVSRETHERLKVYAELLLRWNQSINLISRADEPQFWQRHVEDSLQLVPHIPLQTERAIDLGSGGGLPGLVLAIATGIPFDLVESDNRKAAFLREAARATAAPISVHAVRIETANLPKAALITARALAHVTQLLGLMEHLLARDGTALLLKGAAAEQELTDAQAAWNMRIQRFPSRTHPAGVILKLSEVTRA
jgi:16S rRNA (guanine527-N7)-methyltransferase